MNKMNKRSSLRVFDCFLFLLLWMHKYFLFHSLLLFIASCGELWNDIWVCKSVFNICIRCVKQKKKHFFFSRHRNIKEFFYISPSHAYERMATRTSNMSDKTLFQWKWKWKKKNIFHQPMHKWSKQKQTHLLATKRKKENPRELEAIKSCISRAHGKIWNQTQ